MPPISRKTKHEAIMVMVACGKSNKEIVTALKNLEVTPKMVWATKKQFDETGSIEDRPKRGQQRSMRMPALVKAVRQKMIRNPRRNIKKMARESNVSATTMQRVVHDDLKMGSYRLQKRQLLTKNTRAKRLARAKVLLERDSIGMLPPVPFIDEKIFMVDIAHNPENPRVLARDIQKVPIKKKLVFRTQKPASCIVWVVITTCGKKTPLIFIPEGVKVKKDNYLAMLKSEVLLWWEREFAGASYIFQQDKAPSHMANEVQQWCAANFSGFWLKSDWPGRTLISV